MVEDDCKHHQKEAEEMGLKIYQNDGVIDEMTEFVAFKFGQLKRKWLDGGEQVEMHKKSERFKNCFPPHHWFLWGIFISTQF